MKYKRFMVHLRTICREREHSETIKILQHWRDSGALVLGI